MMSSMPPILLRNVALCDLQLSFRLGSFPDLLSCMEQLSFRLRCSCDAGVVFLATGSLVGQGKYCVLPVMVDGGLSIRHK